MSWAWDYMLGKYYEHKWDQHFKKLFYKNDSSKKMVDAINDSILPITYKPTKDGLFLKTNDTYIQCLVVGHLSPKNKNRQDIPDNFDGTLIPELLNTGTNKDTSIELCQIVCPLLPEEQNEDLYKADRSIRIASIIQEGKDKILRRHNKVNDYAAEDVDALQRKIYKGETKLFHFTLLIAVQGVTKKQVTRTINNIKTILERRVILCETPVKGMDEVYKTMMPTPYIWPKLFKRTVATEICAKTSLFLNPNPLLADHGRFIGINERTGNPIFFSFDDPENVCGHALEIGRSGIGKSTDLLKDDIRAYMDGDDVVHIVPKKDKKTNHQRVCEALSGYFLKFGDLKKTPNMLQVFFDKTRMEDTVDGRQAAYNASFSTLLTSIGLLVGSGYTDPQKNWLCESLSKLYYDKEVIDDKGRVRPDRFDRWDDGEFWPWFPELRAIWYDWINDGKHKNVEAPIQALYNNTTMLEPMNPLGYLSNHNKLDLSNRFIVADLSSLSKTPNVQQAMTLLLMSIINTKLECANEDADLRKCLITLDEGADLLKNPYMRLEIEDLFRKGRSSGAYIKIVAQDLAAFDRDILEMIKANTDYILLFGGYRPDNIGPIIREFNLTDEDIARLLEQGKGRGVLILGGHHIFYLNALDEFEKNLLFGKGTIETDQPEKQEAETSSNIDPTVEWVVKDYKILCKDWISNMTEYPTGYLKETETNPVTGKRTVVFYKRDLLKEDGHIKNQTKKHYFTVCMLGGECLRLGASSVTFDDYGQENLPGTDQKQIADVVATFPLPNGRDYKVAFEVETPEKKASINDLRNKRETLKNMKSGGRACFDDVIFIGQHDYIPHLVEALGDEFVLQRGVQVAEYIENIKTGKLPVSQPPSSQQTAEAA